MSSLTLGYSMMLVAFFCFAVMDTSAKWLVAAAIPALQVAWLRYLGHFLCTLLIYLPSEGRDIVRSQRLGFQLLRAFFLLCATALNFSALQYLPLTTTIAIFFGAPLVVCLLSIPVLGEKVGIKRLLAVLVGFGGVLVIVEPWSQSFDPHIVLSLLAMLCASAYFLMSRFIAGSDSNATTQFYVSGLATVLLAPFALTYWVWPASIQDWGVIVLIGSLGMIGHSFLTNAHKYAQASVLAPAVYSQVIYIAILSWIIFGEPPNQQTLLGTLIIVASGLFIWFRERQVELKDSQVQSS
ncbi:MAG: DMT family transporter [Granulosicoccus sp.]